MNMADGCVMNTRHVYVWRLTNNEDPFLFPRSAVYDVVLRLFYKSLISREAISLHCLGDI